MGIPFSKSLNSASNNVATTTTTLEYASELTSYESACIQDPSLQSFDQTLQRTTSHAISSLATDIDPHSLSFDTLRVVTGCLLDLNQEVVETILESKKDIWKNPELFDVVKDYFDNSLQTLDLCASLERCLTKARDSQLIVHIALKHFKDEDEEEVGNRGRNKYERTLEELRHFKAVGDHPFSEEFFQIFHSVYKQQVSMLEKLQSKKRKLDKKLKTVKTWRKVLSVIYVSVFASVLIFSVVAAAISAPPVVTALAASMGVAMGPIGKWINSLWKDYMDALKGQHEILDTVQVRTFVTISDLDSIRVLVDKLESQISSLLQNVEFALEEEEAVRFVIEEIKGKLEVFMKTVEDLQKQTDRCDRDIRKARTVLLQRIIRHLN